MTGLWVLLGAVVVALSFGLYRHLTDGRARLVAASSVPHLDATVLGRDLGDHATFVQFSSTVCAPCRATRALLADVTAARPGVVHIEVDAETRLDLVERFGIMRTPTVLLLDSDGLVRQRIVGAPRKAEVLDALDEAMHAA
ncbi:thioredoxin family protein [Propioniciclava flava]